MPSTVLLDRGWVAGARWAVWSVPTIDAGRRGPSVRIIVRVSTAVTAVLLLAGCSGGGRPSPSGTVKPSDVDAALKALIRQDNTKAQQLCQALFPTAPLGIIGGQSNAVTVGSTTAMAVSCEFSEPNCTATLGVSPTSSGRDDPKGLDVNQNRDGYADQAIDHGVEIAMSVKTSLGAIQPCVLSIQAGKQSITYLKAALARIASK